MAFTIPPDLIARLAQNAGGGFPGKGGGLPMPVNPGGPGKGGGAPVSVGGAQQNFGQMVSPMAGAAPGTMPNIREAMMANVGGMLGRPNFGIPQFAPRAGQAGVMPPSAPPVSVLPNPVSPTPIGNNPGDRFGFRGRSIYSR